MSTNAEQYNLWCQQITAAVENLTWTVVRDVTPAAEGRVSNSRMRANGWTNRDQIHYHIIVTNADGVDVTDALYSMPYVESHLKRRKDAETLAAEDAERFTTEWLERGSWFSWIDGHIAEETLQVLGLPIYERAT